MRRLILAIFLVLVLVLQVGATTYNIGPGQTYETFTALEAAVVFAPGDIVDGGGNIFLETWDPAAETDGTEENPIIFRNATIDGESTRAQCIELKGCAYITLSNIQVQGATAAEINTESAAGTIITGCTIINSAGRGLQLQHSTTVTGGTVITSTATGNDCIWFYAPSAGIAYTFDNITINNGGVGTCIDFNYSGTPRAPTVLINDVTATIFGANGPESFLSAVITNETGSLTVSNNTITSTADLDVDLIYIRGTACTVVITDNVINMSGGDDDVCWIENQPSPVVANNIITADSNSETASIKLSSTGTNMGAAVISGNSININYATGYGVYLGSEKTGSGDNNLDGAIIRDNIITVTGNNSIHGILCGFTKNAVIERNIITNAGYSIVVKDGGSNPWTAGGVFFNNIINSPQFGIYCKGSVDVNVYNNTIEATDPIVLLQNTEGTPSTGVEIKNCILKSTQDEVIVVRDTSTLATGDYANNCLYAPDGVAIATYQTTDKTYAAWVSDGYDSNSINSDPLFNADLSLPDTSPCIGAGAWVVGDQDIVGKYIAPYDPINVGAWHSVVRPSAGSIIAGDLQ